MRVADRVHRHFFNDGVLTPAAARDRVARRTNEIFSAVVLESARWGFQAGHPVHQERRVALRSEPDPAIPSFPAHLGCPWTTSGAGWYPAVDAPNSADTGLLPGHHRDQHPAPAGNIYFTTDGSDPRAWEAMSPRAHARIQAR